MPDLPETFGVRCARQLKDRGLIEPQTILRVGDIIDAERAAVIAAHARKTAEAGPPAPPPSPPAASSTPEDFGDRKEIPPTPDQVTRYSRSRGKEIDGQAFCDFYQSKGWLVGKAKMKDWQAATRTAIAGDYFRKPNARDTGRPPRDITKF